MKDIQRQLQDGEEILFVAQPSRITLVPMLFLTLLFAIGSIVVWKLTEERMILYVGLAVAVVPLLAMLQQLIVLRSNVYVVTNHRVIRQSGILTKSSVDSYLDKINNVEHRQTFWGRILGYGDVEIDTASETGMTSFRMIRHPLEFKRALVSAAEQYRRPGGLAAAGPTGAERLRQLKQLLDEGLISQEEFDQKRSKLIDVL